jgi:hypothetical protein
MPTSAVFPQARAQAGMYESFYLRAVSPKEPVGVWIRHTVSKPPGQSPTGSVWCTVFDAGRGRPFMHKVSGGDMSVPAGGWIGVGDARMTPAAAAGDCGPAEWSLEFASEEPELRHLPREWLYRAPLPRTKLTSPAPAARFEGEVRLPGRDAVTLDDWPGMVGHNWGSEHAERWIWLHGICFSEEPRAWIDVALGRVKVAGRMTPWVANGALSLGGRRHRIAGIGKRELRVSETAQGCVVQLSGKHGLWVRASVEVPPLAAAGWRYRDPDGGRAGEHDVINCSIAALELTVRLPGQTVSRTLSTEHGAAYELGMREHDHGVPLAPFSDG